MTKIPSREELRERYASVINNQAAANVSFWTEPNTDKDFSAQAMLNHALENGDALNAKLDEALRFDDHKPE